MVEQTKRRLAEMQEAARTALQNEVATLAVQMATQLLQKELQQPGAQAQLVQQLISQAHEQHCH